MLVYRVLGNEIEFQLFNDQRKTLISHELETMLIVEFETSPDRSEFLNVVFMNELGVNINRFTIDRVPHVRWNFHFRDNSIFVSNRPQELRLFRVFLS